MCADNKGLMYNCKYQLSFKMFQNGDYDIYDEVPVV